LILSLFILFAYSLPLGLKEEANVKAASILEKISLLESEPLDHIIRRVIKDNDVSLEYAKSSRISFLRWASLQYFTNESITPSLKVDRFWHAFLMFTFDYEKWCDRHFGSFMHHYPEDDGGDSNDEINGDEIGDENDMEETEKPKSGWTLATKLMFELYGEDWSDHHDEKAAGCDHCSNGKEHAKAAGCCDKCSNGKKDKKDQAAGCDHCSNGKNKEQNDKKEHKAAGCDKCSNCKNKEQKAAGCDHCSNGKNKEGAKAAGCCSKCHNGENKEQVKASGCCSKCHNGEKKEQVKASGFCNNCRNGEKKNT